MYKKAFSVFLALLLLAASVQADAAAKSIMISRSLTFSGSTATCKATATEYGKQIEVTVELWHGNTLLDSWTGSGTKA